MTKLNHDRPELRAKDNIRRELSKVAALATLPSSDLTWPAFMRPVSADPRALKALFDLINSMSEWLDQDSDILELSNPPKSVANAFKHFATRHLDVSHSSGFNGADWLREPVTRQCSNDFRPALLVMFKALL